MVYLMTFSISQNTVSNEGIMNWQGCGKQWSLLTTRHHEILLWKWGKTKNDVSQDSKSPGLESNLVSPGYDRTFFSLNINGKWIFTELMKSLRAGWCVDRIPVKARFSAPIQTGPGAHPASYTMGTGTFPGVKRPGRGVHHQSPSSVEVKKWVELYLYSPSGPSWPVLGWPLPLPVINKVIKIIEIIGV
jgi:hypothetical protein